MHYSKLIKAVFEVKSNWPFVSLPVITKARFDSGRLKNAIEELIHSKGASPVDVFNDGKLRGCRT
jgi:hypothetical protein